MVRSWLPFLLLLAAGLAYAASGGDITYTLPRDAQVTINVLNEKGWVVRELVRGEKQTAGKHTIRWDGCDAFGAPLPPGTYSWKLLHHTGVQADYVLSVANSGQPPYRTEDDKGSWGGCHGNPLCVSADASGLYLTWLMEEGNATFTKTDYDGKTIFKHHSTMSWGRNYASAVHNGILYRLEASKSGALLLSYDAATGKYANWEAKSPDITGGRLRIGGPEPTVPNGERAPNLDPQAVAVNDNAIAVGFPGANKVVIIKPSGEIVKEITLDGPKGLAFLPDGKLVVCQGKQVVAIDVAAGTSAPFITKEISSPWGITLAGDGKSLWITDQGDSQQVKQFDLTGKLLKAFGKPGGTPTEGRIDHNSFFMPRGIACGADGNIYVTEDSALRRISRWSADGKLLREWFGPLGPQKTCWPNLNNFREVYYQHWGTIIRCDVDLAKKTWYPVAWYKADVPNGAQPYVWEANERKYMFAETGKLLIYNPEKDRWQVGVDFHAGTERQRAIWTDLNGDGQQSADELQPGYLNISMARIDLKTLAIYASGNGELISIVPERIVNGLPVYKADSVKRLTKYSSHDAKNGWYVPMPIYGIYGCEPTADGGVLTAYNGGKQQFRSGWDRASWNYLARFDAQGELCWQVGVHTTSRQVPPTKTLMFMRTCGVSKGVVFITDVGSQFHAYTDDGLYVGSVMDFNDGSGGHMPLSPNSITVENITGLLAEDPATEKTYLFAGITEDARIWEITGLETLQRMNGTVQLATAELPTIEKTGEYRIGASKPPRKSEYNDIGADGFLNDGEWAAAPCLPLVDEGVLRAKFYLRYDDKYLWIGAQVWDKSPAKNATQDPEVPFTLGDCVDLYFSSDPAVAKTRNIGGLGDLRIVLTPVKDTLVDNGMITLYRPKVADGVAKKPYTFGSPVSEFTMDYVGQLTGRDAVTNGALCSFWRWRDGAGYTCEAKIPLSELPELGIADGKPVAEHTVAFDAGVIFSNTGGTSRAERIYWQQDDGNTHCITDLPTEAQLYPRLWGTAVIGLRQ